MITVTELLQCARKRIERGWCQRNYAVTEFDEPVSSSSPAAARWCSIGALNSCASQNDARDQVCKAERVLEDVLKGTGGAYRGVVHFNDEASTTQEDVLRLFDAAIAKGE